ncbi:MAG: hypothetical protein ISS49_12720 [Anaerolineae bacterium]|nr:hypothetical protein [Anaerolineae bacterium]
MIHRSQASKRREYVDRLEELIAPYHVLRVGRIRPEWVAGIATLSEDNLDVVLTQPRWAYVQAKPDGRARFVDLALAAVLNPDQVHRDRHALNAIFYKRLGGRGYLKVVLWLQGQRSDRQHSIGDFYPKDTRKVEKKRKEWLVWQKE